MNGVLLGHCVRCEARIDASGPAVSLPPRAKWEPFLEDVRSSDCRYLHASCFVIEYGADALIEAVHLEDLRRVGRHPDRA